MKTRNPMNPKLLMPLLLAVLAAPAQADEGSHGGFGGAFGGVLGGVFGSTLIQVAQYNAEERRAMRDRWEQAGPEERLRMRREYKDKERSRQFLPDPRGDPAEQWRNPYSSEPERQRAQQRQNDRQRGEYANDASFGFGFERRRHEDERVENPPPGNFPYPGNFFERRKPRENDRDRRRDDDRR